MDTWNYNLKDNSLEKNYITFKDKKRVIKMGKVLNVNEDIIIESYEGVKE